MFDSCTSRTNRPFANTAQALHVVHYSFGLNGLSQRNRYFYLDAAFPNLKKTARSFEVTVTPHVKGLFLNTTTGNQTYAEITTDVVQRTITIECEADQIYCESDYFLRFGDIDFENYQVDVLFNSTESLVLNGSNVQFRKTWGTESFTDWLIGMKLFFLFLSLIVAVCYSFCINKLSAREQNIEQGFVVALVVSLIYFNDPFYFAEATYGSNSARILSVGFQTTFFQMLLLFWLVALDNLRLQGKESGVSNTKFFAPKIIFVACFWIIMALYYGYLKYNSNNDVILILLSLTEIRKRRMRYRYLVGLSLLMTIPSFSGLASGAFSPTPSSGGAWTSLQALFNVYVFTLCYLYAPSATTLENLRKRKQAHGDEDPESKAVLNSNVVNPIDVELAGVDEIRETDLA
ncbi:hypothetical protein BBO99_00003447 [Phytophthora kernoviae]|uniref:Wntless-like transmembrane domain-containing protein n=1 Tax=Phytophthora kernoviae TaxID=325452 RepID=A0A3R7J6Y9_9STRA|nr:hypothetical protein JM18_004914 [Phytophthora kernoviae]KAG2525831.1 hypothetical protein JM16_003134 [Phytophthora kernoviae]RLN13715.1 hypothetical protein BBI17_003498 [Phytophthora kernoviae]RLN81734.1 hypothetical protein BBO99_00003447 [Phytophthora kernoviae]